MYIVLVQPDLHVDQESRINPRRNLTTCEEDSPLIRVITDLQMMSPYVSNPFSPLELRNLCIPSMLQPLTMEHSRFKGCDFGMSIIKVKMRFVKV